MKKTASSDTLLDYALTTSPNPLQVSPKNGNPIYAALTLVVSNGGNTAVSLESLQVTIPPDLTDSLQSILYNADPQRIWNITPASPGVFNILPVSGKPVTITTQGVVFQFFNIAINEAVGTVQIGVIETASAPGNPSDDRPINFPVTKFPYGFFFDNFTPQVPLIQDNQTVTLTWEGSNQATYAMYYNNKVEDVTNLRKWTSPALTSDTTFLLRAVVISQGEMVTKDLTTTVTVTNPEIRAQSIHVNADAIVYGLMRAENGLMGQLEVLQGFQAATITSNGFNLGTGNTGWLRSDQVTVNNLLQTNLISMGPGWTITVNDDSNLIICWSGYERFRFTQDGDFIANGIMHANGNFDTATPDKNNEEPAQK